MMRHLTRPPVEKQKYNATVCNKCPLHLSCWSVKIPGRGKPDPDVLFVGQAPGAQEDDSGKCFVGPAGQLLRQVIVRYKLGKCHATNLVKCFPPRDRNPNKKEIRACKPYLVEEIKQLRPKVIVPLGSLVLGSLTPETKISEWSGRKLELDGQVYFPLYHPAYILRYPHMKREFEAHVKRLENLIVGKQEPEMTEFVEPTSPREAKSILASNKGMVAFDYETTGVVNGSCGRIRCAGFSTGWKRLWVDAQAPGFRNFMKWFLKTNNPKAAHNSVFERRCSWEHFRVWPKNLNDDTKAMQFCINPSVPNHLESIVENITDHAPWKLNLKGSEWETVDLMKLGNYCMLDADYTMDVFYKLSQSMLQERRNVYENIQIPLTKVIARMEFYGTYVDSEWMMVKSGQIADRMHELECSIKSEHASFVQSNYTSKKPFNLKSDFHIRALLENLKVDTGARTDGKLMSVAKGHLVKVMDKHVTVEEIMEWRELYTLRNNFLEKLPRFADEHGIIRPRINPFFVVSGRLSVSSPPLQAIPRDSFVKGCVSSRWPGGHIVTGDFKQLEMRLVASESGEAALLKAISEKKDLHDLTATQVFGGGFTSKQRDMAKRINFGIVYGITEFALAEGFNLNVEYCRRLLNKFKKKNRSLYTWMIHQHQFAEKHGYIGSRFGRVRVFGNVRDMPDWQKREVERQSGNFPIQSQGGDMCNLSCILVWMHLVREKMKSICFLQVHDSVMVDAWPGEEEKVAQILRNVMEREVPSRMPWLRVPIEVDITTSRRWGGD